MTAWVRAAVLALAACLASCGDLTDTHRWSSSRLEGGTGKEVEVRVYVAPSGSGEAASPGPLSALSDRGQAAAVGALDQRIRDDAAFAAAILKPKDDTPPADPFSTIDREKHLLVVTTTRPSAVFAPGDRIMRAVVRVQPINFTFGGYTVAQTARQTVDITTLTRTSKTEGSVSVSAPVGAPIGGSAGLTASRELGTSTKLTEAPEKLTVDMAPSCMRAVQEGAHSVDITGNLTIAASLLTRLQPAPEECNVESGDASDIVPSTPTMAEVFVADPGLRFKNGAPDLAGKTAGSLRTYPTQPLVAKVAWEYVLRHVVSSGSSYDEGEQGVALVSDRLRMCCGGAAGSDSRLGCGPERTVAGWPTSPARPSVTPLT